MIKKLVIENFQSHKKTELDFSPGVNVIIGSSDSGKSAILRALRWAMWNRPLGDSFRSHWGGDTSVILHGEDFVIERFKGKGGDRYTLHSEDQFEPLEFRAFGTDVPEEIRKSLALTELNIQAQHDSSFLLSSNAGEVARHFNKIARIDKIDSSLTKIESWLRAQRQGLQAAQEETERHESDLKDFEYLDKMEANIEILEGLQSELEHTRRQIQVLTSTISEIETAQNSIEDLSEILQIEEKVDALIILQEQRDNKRKRFRELKKIVLEILDLEKEIQGHEELTKDEPQIDFILDHYTMAKQIQVRITGLEKLINEYQATETSIEAATEILTNLEEEWHSNLPDVCPLCGRS